MLLEKSEVFFFFFKNKTNAIPHWGFYSSTFVYSHFFLKDSVYLLFAYCLVHYLREVFWNLGLHQIARKCISDASSEYRSSQKGE